MYVSDILGTTNVKSDKTNTDNKINIGGGLLFTTISGVAVGLIVANFRHTEYLPTMLVGGICGGILGKVLI